MRVRNALLVAVIVAACATASLDDSVTARVESFGGYVVYDALPSYTHPADRIPCKIGTRLGTHFFLNVPAGDSGSFSVITTWTRSPLGAPESAHPEVLHRDVRRYRYPFHDPTGTWLVLTFNEDSDLFPARYEQTVASGSGRVLFRHQFKVPRCPPAAQQGAAADRATARFNRPLVGSVIEAWALRAAVGGGPGS